MKIFQEDFIANVEKFKLQNVSVDNVFPCPKVKLHKTDVSVYAYYFKVV